MLNRETMLARRPRKVERVDLRPHLDGEVFVRVLSAAERDLFEAQNSRIEGEGKGRKVVPQLGNYRARLAVLACCDAEGKALFSHGDEADLGQQPAPILDAIVEAAHRINGMGEDATKDAEKNSETTPAGNG